MNDLHLKYKMDTASSCDEEIELANGGYGTVYTDEYVEWLEERVAPNVKIIEAVRDLVQRHEELGVSAHFLPIIENAKKELVNLKRLGL